MGAYPDLHNHWLGRASGMSESAIPFWLQATGTVAVLACVIACVWWQMRRQGGEEFSVLRVLGVALAAALGSLPFVAAWWWLAPQDADRHSPLLLGAVFVPVFALEAWGLALMLRRRKQRKA
jgi:hypothetical protein